MKMAIATKAQTAMTAVDRYEALRGKIGEDQQQLATIRQEMRTLGDERKRILAALHYSEAFPGAGDDQKKKLKEIDGHLNELRIEGELLESRIPIAEERLAEYKSATDQEAREGAGVELHTAAVTYLQDYRAWLRALVKAGQLAKTVGSSNDGMIEAKRQYEQLGGHWGGLPDFYGTDQEKLEKIKEILSELKTGGDLP